MPQSPSFSRQQVIVGGPAGIRNAGLAVSQCLAIAVLALDGPAAGATDDLLDATATVAAPVTVLKAALKSAGLDKLTDHVATGEQGGRKITFTTAGATPADAPATVDITGIGPDGAAQTETLALAQTAATVTSAKTYSDITQLDYPAADGTAATVAIGIADVFSLNAEAADLGGFVNWLQELEDGAVPTAGTIETPTTSPPYGSYEPNSAPDGSLVFLLTYQQVGRSHYGG
jgi:hypothetical protein